MTGPLQPEVDGEFYIDNVPNDFWLRESGAWDKKGRLVRATYVCLVSAGPYPFTASQQFELALGETPIHFYDTFSRPRTVVTCEYPAKANCSVVFTDNLAGFLSTGTNVIVQADFTPASQTANLTINDVIVPAFAPLWVVMPAVADLTMAGLRALFAGEPA
jgi:hypothetical protein